MIFYFWGIILLLTLSVRAGLVWALIKVRFDQIGLLAKGCLVFFPLVVLGSYLLFGGSHQLQMYWRWQRQNLEIQQKIAQIKDPQQLIDQLEVRLQQDPNSAQGWYLLGKLYLDQQHYQQAESALTKSWQLQPTHYETVVALAKANFFSHQGHLTPSMVTLLLSVIKSLPEPVDALNLLAVDAYRKKDFRTAVDYWRQAFGLSSAR